MINIYSIHDNKAEYFLPPLFAKTDSQAQRMFVGSLGESFIYRADFNLFKIGSFNDDTGEIMPENPPLLVLSGLSVPAHMDPLAPQRQAPPDGHRPVTGIGVPNGQTDSNLTEVKS